MEDDCAFGRVARFLAEHSGRDPKSIRPDELLAAFEVDSLEDVVFIMELEDEFGVEILAPGAPLVTVADLAAFVRTAKPEG